MVEMRDIKYFVDKEDFTITYRFDCKIDMKNISKNFSIGMDSEKIEQEIGKTILNNLMEYSNNNNK